MARGSRNGKGKVAQEVFESGEDKSNVKKTIVFRPVPWGVRTNHPAARGGPLFNPQRACAQRGLLYCLVCVYVCVSVRSFLPPRASRPRNIGTYVFIATRKILL